MPKLARILAWTLVAALCVVTLAPIGFRPVLADSANLERAMAYGLLGILLAAAYPRHPLLAVCAGMAIAAGLELGQGLTADRHGRVADFIVKAGAAGVGVLAVHLVIAVQGRLDRARACAGR